MTEGTLESVVGGDSVPSQNDATVGVTNPSNGRRFLSIPAGCEADVNRAVASARCGFDDGRWHRAPPSFRKKTLHAFADRVEKCSGELDALDAEEMGKPVREVFANAAIAAGLVRFYAEAIDKVIGAVHTSDSASFVSERRVPRGVVGAITPWNFPTYVAVLKLAPALAAGNCVVLKPSELSSRSALRLAQLALEAGLPAGVFNVVLGRGDTVGKALGLHMDVDLVSFMGSTAVGKLMMSYAGQSNLKVVMAECRGKSPQIVFDDGVDVEGAAESIARMILTNQGQLCSVGSRVLVQKSIGADLVAKIAECLQCVVMGDAQEPATTFGPLASAQQFERVMQYIDAASSHGARLAAGGRRALPESGGYFVEPTMFCDVPPSAPIAQEEIFGPVLSVILFQDEAQAISIANRTIYGLATYVWTADLARAMRMANGIRSSIWVNAAPPRGEGAGFASSYEAMGQSGMGVEGGLAGMESYMRRQHVSISHA